MPTQKNTVKKIKLKKCKYSKCGQMFEPNPTRFNQQTCDNVKCALGYVNEKKEAAEKKKVDEIVKAFKHDLEVGDLSKLKERLQGYINKIVRLIDSGCPCMSSGAMEYTAHAGHFFSRGSNPALSCHLLNIWAQRDSDNTYGGGMITQYRTNLVSTFGQGLIEEIDGLKAKYPVLKPTKFELIEYIAIARRITIELENAAAEHFKQHSTPLVYSTEERIELRRTFNKRLGIYK